MSRPRMTKIQLAWLVLLLISFGSALAYGLAGEGNGAAAPARPAAVSLDPLRAQAALTGCPTGLSPDLPDLTLPCLGGGPDVSLRGPGSGRPTIVNVYGSWCTPCQREMPVLRAFHESSPMVDLVGVDTLDEPRLALLFARDVGQHWPAVVDSDGVVNRAFGQGVPKTLFIDAAGKVVHTKRGEYRNLAALKADVQRYLGVTT